MVTIIGYNGIGYLFMRADSDPIPNITDLVTWMYEYNRRLRYKEMKQKHGETKKQKLIRWISGKYSMHRFLHRTRTYKIYILTDIISQNLRTDEHGNYLGGQYEFVIENFYTVPEQIKKLL